MGIEIERKFLVDNSHFQFWKIMISVKPLHIRQGYLAQTDSGVIRIRIQDEQAFLTLKSATVGVSREEYEYEIPKSDGIKLLGTCDSYLEKYRYVYPVSNGLKFEIDDFVQLDLIIAEIELPSEDTVFDKPEWLLGEVSSDPRYFNNNILERIKNDTK